MRLSSGRGPWLAWFYFLFFFSSHFRWLLSWRHLPPGICSRRHNFLSSASPDSMKCRVHLIRSALGNPLLRRHSRGLLSAPWKPTTRNQVHFGLGGKKGVAYIARGLATRKIVVAYEDRKTSFGSSSACRLSLRQVYIRDRGALTSTGMSEWR